MKSTSKAVGLAIIVSVAIWISGAHSAQQSNSTSGVSNTEVSRVVAKQDASIEFRDLRAQEAMARYAQQTLWATWIGVLASSGAALLVFLTLRATLKFNKEVRSTSEKQLRAYIAVESVYGLKFLVGEKVLVRAVIKNTGQTPSMRTQTGETLYVCDNNQVPRRPNLNAESDAGVVVGSGCCIYVDAYTQNVLSQHDFDEVVALNKSLVLYFDVLYEDIFESKYRLDFSATAKIEEDKFSFQSMH